MKTSTHSYKRFKGTPSEYTGLHNRMKKEVGEGVFCGFCCLRGVSLEFANMSQEYLEEASDWRWLCRSCHKRYDSTKYRRVRDSWEKICTKCNQWLSEDLYYKRKSSHRKPGGKDYQYKCLTSWCIECTKAWSRWQKTI